MTRDASLLNEIWGIISSHIPQKERVEVAHQLVELFDEYSMVDGFEHESEFDGALKVAVVEYFDLELDSDEEEDEQNDY